MPRSKSPMPRNTKEKTKEIRKKLDALPDLPAWLFEDEDDDKDKLGRPTVLTREALHKLETAFLLGCSDREACLVAGISERAFYYFQSKYPVFLQKKELWKQTPTLQARSAVVDSFKTRPEIAMRYLEAKLPVEFNTKINHHMTGDISINYSEEVKKRTTKYAEPRTTKRKDDAGARVLRMGGGSSSNGTE